MATVAARETARTDAWMDAGAVVDRFPGPACMTDGARRLVRTNALWDAMGLARPGDGRHVPAEIAASLLALATTGQPQRVRVRLDNGQSALDVMCLPCRLGESDAMLVLGTDCSEYEQIRDALATSRDFHRDLALCSSDATFEIDGSGRFAYVGPCGFLGFADFELLGREIRPMIAERSRHAAEFILTAREAIDEAELWITGQSGAERCLMISAMPVVDGQGSWNGLRGVGRDLTGLREREAELSAARRTQRRIDAVLGAMRAEIRPSEMIQAGVAALLDVIELDACIVAHARAGKFDRIETIGRRDDTDAHSAQLPGRPFLLDLFAHCADGPDDALHLCTIHGQMVLMAATRNAGVVNGGVAFLRAGGLSPQSPKSRWADDDRHLLRAVAAQISVAIAQRDLFGSSPFALP